MTEKSLEEKVNAALEEAPVVEETPEVAEKKSRAKKAKKEEEIELSPIAREILSWNLPKTLFELTKKWAEGKTEEELEELELSELEEPVISVMPSLFQTAVKEMPSESSSRFFAWSPFSAATET